MDVPGKTDDRLSTTIALGSVCRAALLVHQVEVDGVKTGDEPDEMEANCLYTRHRLSERRL